MTVFIRTDASIQIGTGHLIRCRTLASALKARGADVRFVCRHLPRQMADLLQGEFAVIILPERSETRSLKGYAAWLGVSQEVDAQQTLDAVVPSPDDWIIVDHYGLDAHWEGRVRGSGARLLAIDDLANRLHSCDVLLDQNYASEPEERYAGLSQPSCHQLLGPRYALIRHEYLLQGPRLRTAVDRVLVFFGGADTQNATGIALDALSAPELSHLAVDLVVGAANPNHDRIAQQAQGRGSVQLHGHRPHLADLMNVADLAIGAGGSTTWERLAMGLPATILSIADNQVPASRALAEAGLIEYVGQAEHVSAETLRTQITRLLQDDDRFSRMSRLGPTLVDGYGTGRVAEYLLPTPPKDLRLRPAKARDAALFYGWVNEPNVRAQSLSTDPIPWDHHHGWFNDRVSSASSMMFVLEANGRLPIGQIRFDLRDDHTARLSYLLDPIARGRKLATQLVKMGVERLNRAGDFEIEAEVRLSNLASLAVFDRLGFSHEDVAEAGLRVYRAAGKCV